MKKNILIILATVLIICILSEFSSDNTQIVEVITPRFATVYNSISVKGKIEKKNEDFISINQNGTIIEVNFQENDQIYVGDIILTIKTQDFISDISKENLFMMLNTNENIVLDVVNEDIIHIKSNINGKISSIANANSSVIKGIPFLSVIEGDLMSVVIEIPERYINKVVIGQTVNMTGSSFNQMLNGVIVDIKSYTKVSFDILGNNSEAKIEATVDIINNQSNLITGASVDADIVVDKIYNAVVVPYSVIFQEEKQEYIMLSVEGIATKISVQTRYELSNEVEIISGVSINDIIIMDTTIKEGQKVMYEIE